MRVTEIIIDVSFFGVQGRKLGMEANVKIGCGECRASSRMRCER